MSIQSFNLILDINGDGSYSAWELWEAIRFVYKLPGNLVVEILGHIPFVSPLLGIRASEATGYGSLNGMLATSLSLLFWVVIVVTALNLASPTVEDDNNNETRGNIAPPFPSGPLPATRQTEAEAARSHRPVSRPAHTVPGAHARPRRHRHLSGYLARHAK